MTKFSTANGYTREGLELLQQHNVCSFCGSQLEVFRKNLTENIYFLACGDWRRTAHDKEIEQPASRYQQEGVESFNIEKRRKILTEEHGDTKTKALDKYLGGGVITRAGYSEIVNTMWGEAPPAEKTKAILLCMAYKLNPIFKHIYLIPFNKKDKAGNIIGKDWALVMGIGATRLLAQRKHNFSYLDMTPRAASPEEIRKITGKPADPKLIYGFTWIKDTGTGAEAFGLRWINKFDKVQGQDKGNDHQNLANIRSERQAIDRQYPGEMPEGVEVVDERYMDIASSVITETGELIESSIRVDEVEGEAVEIEELVLGTCPIHNVALVESRFGIFCPTKVDGIGRSVGKKVWCKGVLPKEEVAEVTAPPEEELSAEEERPTRMYDPEWLAESLSKKKLNWQDATVKSWLKVKFHIDTSGTITEVVDRLNREQLAGFVKEIQDRLGML